MSRAELEQLLKDITRLRVAVVGDLCLDVYWHLDLSASDTSLETGKPTQPVRSHHVALGGAGNITGNLTALRPHAVYAGGVLGDDPWGREVMRLLRSQGVNTDAIITQHKDWDTLAFVKPHIDGSEQSRIDFGNFNRLSDDTAADLIERINTIVPHVDVVVLNQQESHGIHTDFLRGRLRELMGKSDALFIVDSRIHGLDFPGAYLKLNAHEAACSCGVRRNAREPLSRSETERAAEILFHRLGKAVFVTCGAEGCLVGDEHGLHAVPAVSVDPPLDTVGAGDSALAGIAAALAANRSPIVAAEFGNLVAAITVKKLHQTGTATPDELLAVWDRRTRP